VTICPANFFSTALPFLLRDLGRLDFKHVAHRRFLDEIFGLGCDPEGGVDAGLFSGGLPERRRRDKRCGQRRRHKECFHGDPPHHSVGN
jgi:hypothetical protein